MQENFVIYNEEYVLVKDILKDLTGATKSEIAFITDSEGHCIASTGDMEDSYLNSISSLIAGSIAAVNSIAQMLNMENFTSILTESNDKNLYVTSINNRTMLIIIFEKDSNLGLVRFRVKNSTKALEDVFVKIDEKAKANVSSGSESLFEGVTDADIDEIFGD